MYYVTEFCRVCLQYDKTLIDIMEKRDEPDTLLNKLKLCVSEVEWSSNSRLLMCQRCIDRLNSAFDFKRQCLHSAETFESYLSILLGSEEPKRKESKVSVSLSTKDVSQEMVDEFIKWQKEEEAANILKQSSFIRVKSDQQLYPTVPNVLLAPQSSNQNTFQNIFLNLIPANAVKCTTTPGLNYISRINNIVTKAPQFKDANQNMFLNINNTLHKIYPIVPQNKDALGPRPTLINPHVLNPLNSLHSPNLLNPSNLVSPGQNVINQPNNLINHPQAILKQFTPIQQSTNLTSPQINHRPTDINISQILTETKTEEVSVEIDPSYFECMSEGPAAGTEDQGENNEKDWEELITSNKISSETLIKSNPVTNLAPSIVVPPLARLQEANNSQGYENSNSNMTQNITDHTYNLTNVGQIYASTPKVNKDFITPEFEEKMEFFNAGHFMTPSENLEHFNVDSNSKFYMCEQCGQNYDTLKSLRYHIKQFHLGKFPYKCKYCLSEYAVRSQYEHHMQKHADADPLDSYEKDTITLDDLSKENAEALFFPNMNKPPTVVKVPNVNKVPVQTTPKQSGNNSEGENADDNGLYEHQCNLCPRSFTSAHGLSRHKVRKHNQQNRKKYFIKGMKNAKCDICKREFSTQSYLQLHIKLHYRKSDYRRKVFSKDDYDGSEKTNEQERETKESKDLEKSEIVTTEPPTTEMEVSDVPEIAEQSSNLAEKPSNLAEKPSNLAEKPSNLAEKSSNLAEKSSNLAEKSSNLAEKSNNLAEKSSNLEVEDSSVSNNTEEVHDENKSETNNDDAEEKDDDSEENESEDDQSQDVPGEENMESKESEISQSNKINEDVQMLEPSQGIKIKINLRNLKQSSQEIGDIKNDYTATSEINGLTPEESNENTSNAKDEDMCVDPPEEELFLNGVQDDVNSEDVYFQRVNEYANTSDENNGVVTPTEFLEENRSGEDYLDMMDGDGTSDPNSMFSSTRIEMVNGKPKCSFCNKLFSRKHDLKRHMNNIHLKSIEYQCHMCNSKFYEAFHLTRHLRQHNSFLCCITCTKNFNVLRDLKHHILTAHDGNASSQCGACGQVFQKVKYLKEHMQEHDKNIVYKCHICSDDFVESRELTRHLVGHSGMYSCNVCQTTFSTEHELNIHAKVHTSDASDSKKYECEICHNKYKKKRYLVSHINHCHKVEKQNVEILIDRVQSDYSDDSSPCNVAVDC